MRYQWIYGTHTYELSDHAPFDVVTIDGIDVPAVDAITEQGPLQDGDSDLDMRLNARVVQLLLQATTRAAPYDHETNRALFNKIFAPSTRLGTLQITYDNGNQFAIAARCLGNAGVKRGLEEDRLLRAAVAFRCPDPLWYDPTEHVLSFGVAAGGGSFQVPTAVPTGLGASTINQTLTINYAGTYKEYPQITIYGPITNPKITNVATGKKIDFTGFSLIAGDYYTIDLRYGRKYVYKNGVTTDIHTGETSTDSNLATFAIEANPIATDGVNPITVTGTGANSNTQVYLRYFDRYAGI